MLRTGATALSIVLFASLVGGQVPLTGERHEHIVALARNAAADHPAEPQKAAGVFAGAIQIEFGNTSPLQWPQAELNQLEVMLASPVFRMYADRHGRLQRSDPLPSTEYDSFVAVFVNPTAMNSPDIVKVLVQRPTRLFQPQAGSKFDAREFRNGFGVVRVLHSGYALFDAAAFEPTEPVVISLIRNSGQPIDWRLDVETLKMLR